MLARTVDREGRNVVGDADMDRAAAKRAELFEYALFDGAGVVQAASRAGDLDGG